MNPTHDEAAPNKEAAFSLTQKSIDSSLCRRPSMLSDPYTWVMRYAWIALVPLLLLFSCA